MAVHVVRRAPGNLVGLSHGYGSHTQRALLLLTVLVVLSFFLLASRQSAESFRNIEQRAYSRLSSLADDILDATDENHLAATARRRADHLHSRLEGEQHAQREIPSAAQEVHAVPEGEHFPTTTQAESTQKVDLLEERLDVLEKQVDLLDNTEPDDGGDAAAESTQQVDLLDSAEPDDGEEAHTNKVAAESTQQQADLPDSADSDDSVVHTNKDTEEERTQESWYFDNSNTPGGIAQSFPPPAPPPPPAVDTAKNIELVRSRRYQSYGISDSAWTDLGHQTEILGIIIPFRNRHRHLRIFQEHMHAHLERQRIRYKIIVLEQIGVPRLFNRGWCLNMGFKVARESVDYVVLHDVDMLPEESVDYSYPRKSATGVRHLSSNITQFSWTGGLPYHGYCSGVMMLTTAAMEKVDGYANMYWGWGAEDDDFCHRIQHYIFDTGGEKMMRHAGSADNIMALGRIVSRLNGESFTFDKVSRGVYDLIYGRVPPEEGIFNSIPDPKKDEDGKSKRDRANEFYGKNLKRLNNALGIDPRGKDGLQQCGDPFMLLQKVEDVEHASIYSVEVPPELLDMTLREADRHRRHGGGGIVPGFTAEFLEQLRIASEEHKAAVRVKVEAARQRVIEIKSRVKNMRASIRERLAHMRGLRRLSALFDDSILRLLLRRRL
ncbi:glycosyltransferase family 7 protein [Pseudoscourfieldia marina]